MPLSDILSCPEEQLAELITLEEPYSRGSWFMAKGISSIELSMFGEISGVDNYDSLPEQFSLIGEPLPDGPWPQKIPESLIQTIMNLTESEISRACKPWSEIEELSGYCKPTDLEDYLRRLKKFTQENSSPLFLVDNL